MGAFLHLVRSTTWTPNRPGRRSCPHLWTLEFPWAYVSGTWNDERLFLLPPELVTQDSLMTSWVVVVPLHQALVFMAFQALTGISFSGVPFLGCLTGPTISPTGLLLARAPLQGRTRSIWALSCHGGTHSRALWGWVPLCGASCICFHRAG